MLSENNSKLTIVVYPGQDKFIETTKTIDNLQFGQNGLKKTT